MLCHVQSTLHQQYRLSLPLWKCSTNFSDITHLIAAWMFCSCGDCFMKLVAENMNLQNPSEEWLKNPKCHLVIHSLHRGCLPLWVLLALCLVFTIPACADSCVSNSTSLTSSQDMIDLSPFYSMPVIGTAGWVCFLWPACCWPLRSLHTFVPVTLIHPDYTIRIKSSLPSNQRFSKEYTGLKYMQIWVLNNNGTHYLHLPNGNTITYMQNPNIMTVNSLLVTPLDYNLSFNANNAMVSDFKY